MVMWNFATQSVSYTHLAVGEAGLDKLADAPMDLQVEVFRCQACLAEAVGKPLVLHLVKAVDELLKVKRDLRPSKPWIIHGFRGKAALAEEYLKHGFYLSFGEKYQEEMCIRDRCGGCGEYRCIRYKHCRCERYKHRRGVCLRCQRKFNERFE